MTMFLMQPLASPGSFSKNISYDCRRYLRVGGVGGVFLCFSVWQFNIMCIKNEGLDLENKIEFKDLLRLWFMLVSMFSKSFALKMLLICIGAMMIFFWYILCLCVSHLSVSSFSLNLPLWKQLSRGVSSSKLQELDRST